MTAFSTSQKVTANRLYVPGTKVELPANSQKPARKGTVVSLQDPGSLRDGDSIRLEVEGILKVKDRYGNQRDYAGYDPRYGAKIVSAADTSTVLVDFTQFATVLKLETPPVWKAGDVVDVVFSKSDPQPYTYVFDGNGFPGRRNPLSVDRANALWANGQLTIVRKNR